MSKAENFKTGEKAKVVSNIHGNEFEIGTVVTLTKTDDNDYEASDVNGETWYMLDEELSKIEQ